MAKSWIEKLNADKKSKIVELEKAFAGIPEGGFMFVATPKIVDDYVKEIPFGHFVSSKTLCKDLALQNNTHGTCPMSTGIFIRIVAEANFQKLKLGENLNEISPFWRIIDPKKHGKKLSFGTSFVEEKHLEEEIIIS